MIKASKDVDKKHWIVLIFLLGALPAITFSSLYPSFSIEIAEAVKASSNEERDIREILDANNDEPAGIPTNPFELMNRLKKSEAMENATIPSDAIDEALKVFNDQGKDNVP